MDEGSEACVKNTKYRGNIMNHMEINTLDWQKIDGLIPAVIQNVENGNVLIYYSTYWFYLRLVSSVFMKC